MENIVKHFNNEITLLVVLLIAVSLITISIPYFITQQKRYGSPFMFASNVKKIIAGGSTLALVGIFIYASTPYIAPPTDEIAIVIGNTQNTPSPILSDTVSKAIEETLLQHKGEDVSELTESIKIISAIKDPKVISLDTSKASLKEIGNNSSNAKRSAAANIKTIEEKVNTLAPTDNGANYLEAILKARDNVEEGSRIIVIGSGLSDSGDLDFSKSKFLTNENSRNTVVDNIQEKYGSDYLTGYSVEFYGLGDTTLPQEPLPTKQKEIVRNLYKDVIRRLGATVDITTKSLVGDAVKTNYVVGTTDTGCGDIGLIFDDTNLNFVSNKATFVDEAAARTSLTMIKSIWDENSDTIQSIQVDGYIAKFAGIETLSQPRADLVKSVLIELGIPEGKITANGRGVGPYDNDAQNRMVKVNISRNSDVCES